MNLVQELSAASLLESKAAVSALADGETVSKISDSLVTDGLIAIYEFRASHLAKETESHWVRLRKATGEFAASMRSHVGSKGEWLRIGQSGERGYYVYRLPGTQQIIGCMYIIPAQDGVHALT